MLTASRRGVKLRKAALAKEENITGTSIKDMPVFDPDAEINSLALTIPSWISSINRTRSTVEFSLLTLAGRSQLEQKLYQLQKTVEIMLHALKEVH